MKKDNINSQIAKKEKFLYLLSDHDHHLKY